MRKIYLLLLACVPAVMGLNAQVNIDDFEPGKIVLSNGDTLNVRIKPDRDEKMSRQIQVFDVQNSTQKKYLPKDLKYYTLNKVEYFALKDEEGKAVFMELKIKGEANLYGYTYKEEKGKKEVVTDYYIRKQGGGLIKVPTQPSRFRSDMSVYFSDHPTIPEKITHKQYGYFDMEYITEEYNEWVKAGKPKAPVSLQPDDRDKGPRLIKNKVEQEKGSRVGLDIPLFATYNFVSYPALLNQIYTTKTIGFGFDLGAGVRIRLIRGLNMRMGINILDKGMRVTAQNSPVEIQLSDGTNTTGYISFNERGRMYYPGLYLGMSQEWSHFHVGGGFNLLFYSFYRGRYDYTLTYTSGGSQIVQSSDESKAKGSFLVHNLLLDAQGRSPNFNTQFDIHFSVGGRFKIGDNITLKPTLMYSIPMVSLYPSGIEVQGSFSNTQLNVSGYQLKLGLITDIGFK